MLVELLIIKNVKSAGVMLSSGYSSLTVDVFCSLSTFQHMSSGLCLIWKTYICAAPEMEELPLILFIIIKS